MWFQTQTPVDSQWDFFWEPLEFLPNGYFWVLCINKCVIPSTANTANWKWILSNHPLTLGLVPQPLATQLRATLHRVTLSTWSNPTQASLLRTQLIQTTLLDQGGLTQDQVSHPINIHSNLMDGRMLHQVVQCMGKGPRTQVNTLSLTSL